ncbi:MAG: hypothetical protein ACLP1X_05940 [Polyangiaceae bacterium]|jgi:hypothetical protein
MIRAVVAAGLALAVVAHPHARTPPAHGPARTPSPLHPLARIEPLPMLPSVARVRVEAARDRVVVFEDVNLPRGEWASGGLDLYVAFGAPGVPIAIDAQIVPVLPGGSETQTADAGEPVVVETAVRRAPPARPLLGRPQMAGVVVHVKDSQLRHVYETSGAAGLRIRSLLPLPATDADGARDAVVRLGIAGGLPLTLGRVQVVSVGPEPWITRAEASLCGPEADAWPLSVALLPKPPQPAARSPAAPIAPAAAVRHATDDLCVRWWGPR